MNVHKNARLVPQGRLLMVRRIEEEGWRVADAAAAAGLSERRAREWLRRYRAGGEIALQDRSSTPARYRDQPVSERDRQIEELRRQRLSGNAIAFLDRALAWFAGHGVTAELIMTDNDRAYRSHAFRHRLEEAGIRHIRTRPYTPKTNGKAERFIQTSLREWAYARAYQSSAERGHAMVPWIASYNHTRPHSALGGVPPAAKLNNALGFNS